MSAFNFYFTGAAADATTQAALLSSTDSRTQTLMTAVSAYVAAYMAASDFVGKNVDIRIHGNVNQFGVYLDAQIQQVRLVAHHATNSGDVATGNVPPTP